MATTCKLMTQNATLKIDQQYRRTYSHDFHIRTDDKYMQQADVYLAALSASPIALPAYFTSYAEFGSTLGGGGSYVSDGYAIVMDIDIKRMSDAEDDFYDWVATVTWSPPPAGNTSTYPPTANPLNEPIKYQLEWAQFTRIAEFDINGDAIVNSAGDKFDPPLEIDDARPILVATKNMWPLQDVIDLAIEFKNAVNDATFYGAGAREAKVENIVSGPIQDRYGIPYYSVVFRIQFNTDTWDYALVDRGSQIIEVYETEAMGTAQRKAYPKKLDENDNPVDPLEYLDFVNLEPDGTRRADSQPALFTDPWQVYPEKDFSLLGIGTSVYGTY